MRQFEIVSCSILVTVCSLFLLLDIAVLIGKYIGFEFYECFMEFNLAKEVICLACLIPMIVLYLLRLRKVLKEDKEEW
jgi:hypothetical protein